MFKKTKVFYLCKDYLYFNDVSGDPPELVMPLDFIKALWFKKKNKRGIIFVKRG